MSFGVQKKSSVGKVKLTALPTEARFLKVKTTFEGLLNGEIPFSQPTQFPADYLVHDDYSIDTNLSNEDYHAMTDFDSSSRIKQIFKTELNYLNYNSGNAAASMNLGTCIHIVFEDLITGGCKDLESCLDTWTVKDTKTTCIPETRTIAAPYFEILKGTIKEIERLGLVSILKCCFAEVSVFDNVLKHRVRPDIWLPLPNMPFDYMISIKSVSGVSQFKHQISKYHYDLSEGMYNWHMERATQKPFRTCFLLVDTKNNGMIQIIDIGEPTMEQYTNKFETAMELIDKIDRSNRKGYEIILI